MKKSIEICKALIPQDIPALSNLDKRIFQTDGFEPAQLKDFEYFWLLVDKERVGSIILCLHCNDQSCCKESRQRTSHCLHIVSTGIISEYQGRGLGLVLKAFEIMYAKTHDFQRLVTRARASNMRSINLNNRFGFQVVCREPGFYKNPVEDAVIMELHLS